MGRAQRPPSRADVKDADDWWATLGDAQRVSTHRWLSGKSKKAPEPSQEEALIGLDGEVAEEAIPGPPA